MKSDLDQAIKYQDLITQKKYKEYLLEYEPKQLKEEHLSAYAKRILHDGSFAIRIPVSNIRSSLLIQLDGHISDGIRITW